MANDQNFRVKNGLTVGAGAANIIANATTISIGTATVNSTVYSGTANNATNFNGQAASFYVGNTYMQGLGYANLTSGTAANATNLNSQPASFYVSNTYMQGLGYVNTSSSGYVNSSSGTAFNSSNLAGVPATSYVNTSGSYTLTGVITHSANIAFSGNSTSQVLVGTVGTGNGVAITNSSIVIGNSTVNTTISPSLSSQITGNAATAFSNAIANAASNAASIYQTMAGLSANVATLTANNSNNLGGVAAANYVNNSGAYSISGVHTHTANVSLTGNTIAVLIVGTAADGVVSNSTVVRTGNATVFTTINATSFSGIANNANNLGGVAASGYQTTAGLSANVATLTANNANNLGGVAAANYLNNSGAFSISGVHSHTANISLTGNTTAVLILGSGTDGVVSNSTVVRTGNATVFTTINATAFSGIANNASNLGGVAASGYQTTAGLSANVATLTANDSTNLNGVAAANYLQNSGAYTISGVHTYTANIAFSGNSTSQVLVGTIGSGNGVAITNNTIVIGNSTVNTTISPSLSSQITSNASAAYSNAVANAAALYLPKAGGTVTGDITVTTGNVTAVGFSGNGALLTTLNATSLATGTVPDARLSGTYTGFGLKTDNTTTVFSTGGTGTSARRDVLNLVSYKSGSSAATGAIVFTAPDTSTQIMHRFKIEGMLYSGGPTVLTIVQGYRASASVAWTNTSKINLGLTDIQVRWAVDSTGKQCIILGDVGTVWSYPHISITHAMFSYSGTTDAYCQGWTSSLVTSLTGYTGDGVSSSPVTLTNTSLNTTANNADNFNGQPASFYTNATNINAGTIGAGFLPSTVVNTSANFTVAGNIAFTGANTTTNGVQIGYLDIPQRIITAANTITANDAGSHLYNTNTTGTYAVTVPNNTTLALRTGTAVTVINGGNTITIAGGTGVTLRLAGTATTGTRTLANNAVATLIKVAAETWYISGSGVS